MLITIIKIKIITIIITITMIMIIIMIVTLIIMSEVHDDHQTAYVPVQFFP